MIRCSLEECGREFDSARPNQKFCCKRHKYRAANLRSVPTKYPKVCGRADCGIEFLGNSKTQIYCSRSCAASVNNALSPKRTAKERPPKRKPLVEQWLDGEWNGTTKSGLSASIRNYLLKQANFNCQDGRSGCGSWGGTNPKSGKSCLTVDHIDGNCMNNTEDNLKVMCPNCHSMTVTYGALNKGNGRTFRYSQSVVA